MLILIIGQQKRSGMLKLIKKIKKDISKHIDLNDLKNMRKVDIIKWHFGIGLYIRNKYLYKKPKNIKILSEYYHTTVVDTISDKILIDIVATLD